MDIGITFLLHLELLYYLMLSPLIHLNILLLLVVELQEVMVVEEVQVD
jgi:hypothetical protein